MKIELFSRRTLLGRRWFWRVVGLGGQVLAQSTGYRDRSLARAILIDVKVLLADARVVEL